MNPPELKIENEQFVNWLDFEQWAIDNQPSWQHAYKLCQHGQWTLDEAMKWLAYHHTVETERLTKRVLELELIAPKKMRDSNGDVRVYRCPDHLIPLTE